jgi:glutaredoxin
MKYVLTILFLSASLLSFSQSKRAPEGKPELIVYGVDDCHYCHDTRALLDKKKIPYVFYDIDKNVEKRQEMINELKAASMDLKNLNMPVVKKSGRFLLNNGDFENFLKQLIPFVKEDVAKN